MRKFVFAVAIVALIAGAVSAQETTGQIRGYITDPDGGVLPGVTVTLTNPDTGFTRTKVTGRDGGFLFPAIPPGTYELTARLESFQTAKQTVTVQLGGTTRTEIQMQLGVVEDVVEVTSEAPLVDVSSTVAGMTMDAGEINSKIPVVQDTQRISLLAPGTIRGDTAFDGDTFDQDLVSFGGASVAENVYQVNGLDITNFRNGLGSSWVPYNFVEEIQVKTGGYEAEFGRSTGGVVNMVTKSGSNTLHGEFVGYYEPEDLQSNEPNTYAAFNEEESIERLEGNISLGGPFIKDQLFFFGFLQYKDSDRTGVGTTRATTTEEAQPYWGAKIDWNLTPSHRIEGTYLTDDAEYDTYQYGVVTDDAGDFVEIDPTLLSQGTTERGGDNYIVKYTGIFSDNFLLSAQYGENNFTRTDSATGDAYPYAWDATTGSYFPIGYWTNWNRGFAEDTREAWRIDGDLYIGNHSLRAGIDYQKNNSLDQTEYSGGERFDYFLNQPAGADEPTYPDLPPDQMYVGHRVYQTGGDFDLYSQAAYVQDTWTAMPNLTLNLGVRYEQYENENVAGENFIEVDDQYAPRLGAVWDPFGEGRAKVYGSYGMYHLPIASNTNLRMAGAELYYLEYLTVDGWNPDGTPINLGTDPLQPVTYYSDGTVPDPLSTTDENFDPMAQMEYVLGYEQMVGDDWSFGVRAVHRDFDKVIEDIGADWALYDVYGILIPAWWGVLANPGDDVAAWYDTDGDGELERYEWTAEELNYPEPVRKYYALEFTGKKRFSDNWMVDISYTWSHLYGNYEGYVDSTIQQDDAGITQNFDYPGLMDHSWGDLPQDRRHILKVFGMYAWDFGLQTGANFYYQSGRPISGLGVYPYTPDNPGPGGYWDWSYYYGAAAFYYQGEPAPRGSWGHTDDIWGLDVMAKYDFQIADLDMYARIDVFNLFDLDKVTEVQEYSETDNGQPNPNFREPTHYQPPRSIRLGFGVSF